MTTLNHDRTRLTGALVALKRLGVVATQGSRRQPGGAGQANLALLKPTLTKLAEAGKAIPDSLPLLVSFPFPITTLFKAIKGDYMNLFETLDISLGSIQRDFLGSVVPTKGSGGGSGLPIPLPLSTIQQAKNPLTAPLGPQGATTSTTPTKSKNPWPVGSTSPSPSPSPSPSGSCTLVGSLLGNC